MTYTHQHREVLLSAHNLGLTLGNRTILRDIQLTVRNVTRPNLQQGQVIAIVGPSGIGKTQLLGLLAGLLRPSCGEWLIGTTPHPPQPGEVGLVAQHYPLFEHRTVAGNLAVACSAGGLEQTAATQRIQALVEQFELQACLSQYPATLSGGQRQRVAIAQQMVLPRHLLLLDEPFSGLDPVMAQTLAQVLRALSQSDELHTLILVTHDLHWAVSLADTVWLLGREFNDPRPGATLCRSFDLIERDLAWHEQPERQPGYLDCLREITACLTQH